MISTMVVLSIASVAVYFIVAGAEKAPTISALLLIPAILIAPLAALMVHETAACWSYVARIGSDRLSGFLPAARGFATGKSLRFDIAVSDIAALESREEFFSLFAIVVGQRSFRLATRDGDQILFGSGPGPAKRAYKPLFEALSSATGLPVVDRGAVDGSGFPYLMSARAPDWSAASLSSQETSRRRAATRRSSWIFLALLLALYLMSIQNR